MVWLPLLFLYQLERVGPSEVIALEGAYYLANVLFEVPSGVFSDRYGRKATLVLSGLAKVAGLVAFLMAEGWSGLLLGQLGLALSSACVSGSDTSLLHERLRDLGRSGEQASWEARFATYGYGSLALACAAGGLLGSWSMEAALGLGLVLALGQLIASLYLAPDRAEQPTSDHRKGFAPLAYLRRWGAWLIRGSVAWWTVFFVALLALDHLILELLQPVVASLVDDPGNPNATGQRAPGIAGGLLAALFAVSSATAAAGPSIVARFGERAVLILSFSVMTAIPILLSVAWSPWALALILLRKLPQALTLPLIRTALHAQVDDSMRATSFSVLSLLGSLFFTGCLGALAWSWGDLQQLDSGPLRSALMTFGVSGAAVGIALAATSKRRAA